MFYRARLALGCSADTLGPSLV
eukprot:SAG25_NODE_4923_length_731_cov_0.819620_2_plen_21_part_01